jgi:hypothetical protein
MMMSGPIRRLTAADVNVERRDGITLSSVTSFQLALPQLRRHVLIDGGPPVIWPATTSDV